jgi:hypothetical protein
VGRLRRVPVVDPRDVVCGEGVTSAQRDTEQQPAMEETEQHQIAGAGTVQATVTVAQQQRQAQAPGEEEGRGRAGDVRWHERHQSLDREHHHHGYRQGGATHVAATQRGAVHRLFQTAGVPASMLM